MINPRVIGPTKKRSRDNYTEIFRNYRLTLGQCIRVVWVSIFRRCVGCLLVDMEEFPGLPCWSCWHVSCTIVKTLVTNSVLQNPQEVFLMIWFYFSVQDDA